MLLVLSIDRGLYRFFLYLRIKENAMRAVLPPGNYGAPYLGDTARILRDPYAYGKQRFAQYGPVFKTRFLGKPTVVLLSADAHQYVFNTNYRNFLYRDGYGPLGLALFGDGLLMIDGAKHDYHRKMMTPAFHGRHMAAYLVGMNQVIDQQLDAWGASGQFPFRLEARSIAFALATSLIIGLDTEAGVDMERLKQLMSDLIEGATDLARVDVPFTKYGRSLRAKRQMEPILRQIIAYRREHETTDALGLLVSARDEQGNGFTDQELIDEAKILLFAGHDTTASTSAWMLIELLRHPQTLERVRAEIGNGSDPLTVDVLRNQPYLDAVIKETLRLHSQVPIALRGVHEGFDFAGFSIPPRWTAMLLPSFTQLRDTYFTDPDTFDPDRFLEPRNEDAAHPYAFVGFGGGPRSCLGAGVAQMELKALFTKLLRRFDIKLVPGQDLTSTLYMPQTRPKSDVVITYQTR